jgi:quercetin dioxygenase-like cupin family protein
VPRTPVDESVVVADLATELPITPSATTSRVVVANDAMRVVVFAFDAGEQLTEHTSTKAVAVQVLRGALRFEVAGASHDLVAGDLVYLAPNERHALEAVEASLVSLVMVEPPA